MPGPAVTQSPALLIAVTLLLASGCTPAGSPGGPVGAPAPAVSTTTAEDAGDAGQSVQQVSLRVPSMHCPFACWPKVKETLEEQAGVAEVTLAEQAKEDELDNPVVHVRVDGPFDSSQAVEALAKAGFSGAVLEN